MRPLAPVIALALLAGCARSEEPSMVPPESAQGYNQVGQVRSPESDDQEPAIGQWRASIQEERPALEFGPIGTEPLFSLLCAGNNGLWLQRHGGIPAGALPSMQVQVGQVMERLDVAAGGGAIPLLRAEAGRGSQLATALAGAPQPIQVRLDDAAPLILPASPLVGDYVRGCGQSGASAPAGSSNAGNAAAPAVNAAQPAGNVAAPVPPR
jgi:hypothetical protein